MSDVPPSNQARSRLSSAVLAAGLAGLPATALAAIAELSNPAFVDEPLTLWLVGGLVPGLAGAAIGALFRIPPRRWYAALVLLCPTVLVGLSVDDGRGVVDDLELVVVGIDGATWEQADPLIASGELPTLARVRREGASGTLWAQPPLFSPVVWTTMATGRPPEAHGIRGFEVHADDCLVPRFWDIAEASGRRIGIYKWLVGWPPRPVHGFQVPGWLAPTADTWPADLSFVKELELGQRTRRRRVEATRGLVGLTWDGVRHGLRWSTVRDAARVWLAGKLGGDPRVQDIEQQLVRERIDRDVFLFAVQRYRPAVATTTVYVTDALAHRYWRYHEPGAFPDTPVADVELLGEAVRDAYRAADAALGEILDIVPASARVLVVSDHGFAALDASRGVPITPRVGPLVERIRSAVGGEVDGYRIGAKVVLSGVEVDRVTEVVGALRLPRGRRLFRVEEHGDGVVLSVDIERIGPGLLDGALADGTPVRDLVQPVEGLSGDHTARGLFGALGPGVTAGAEASPSTYDIAPIALAALGLPKGADMFGHVPPGVWPSAGVGPSWAPVRERLQWPARTEAVDRAVLEALGYVDP